MPVIALRRALSVLLACGAIGAASTARADSAAQCAASYADAQLARQRGRLLAAREAARACALASCPAVARKDCTAWSSELDREIPSIVVIAKDGETDVQATRVVVDGAPRADALAGRAIELDPGGHALRVERGDRVASITITVFQGERDRLVRVPLPSDASAPPPAASAPPVPAPAPAPAPPPAPPGSHTTTYVPAFVAAGIAVASLGASAVLGVTGRSDLSSLRTTCAPTCTDDQVDPVRRRLLVSDVLLGVGSVAAGVSIYFFVRPPTIDGPSTSLALGPGSIALRRTF